MTFFDMAAQPSGLYNEDRNLLRIRERERRNQEALQERETFNDHAPLFPEPYKTSKGDELSSRLQSMLGNYEEVKELISAKTSPNILGISKSALLISSRGKPNQQSVVSQHSFHSGTQRSGGPPDISSGSSSGQRHRSRTVNERIAGQLVKSHNPARGHPQDLSARERHSESMPVDKSDKQAQDGGSAEQPYSPSSISALSPLLSSLSPPVEPLSPIHSSHQIESKPQSGKSHAKTYSHATLSSPALSDTGNRDGPAPVPNLVPSTQTFPPSLSSKASAMTQKPTAYVRPMDGQDQAPSHSPDLKPLQEDYDEESYGNLVDLKANANEKLSKDMPSEPFDSNKTVQMDRREGQSSASIRKNLESLSRGRGFLMLSTFSNEAHCVEEILKEMTHSWPPLLTAIHTPSTAEPKFPFPTKESQHVPSVKVNQKQYDTSSKVLPSPQQGTSMLEDDLQISDSDDSDEDEVCEKPPSSSAPSSVLQSQTGSVVSAHSCSVESPSSESESSTDSETEESSSESEVNDLPRAATPEPDPDIWQLRHFLNKVGQPTAPTENHNIVDHEQSSPWETQGQGSVSPIPHDSPKNEEPLQKKSPWSSQEEIQNKVASPKSPVAKETITPRQTVGIKQPRKSVKALIQEEPKGGLKVESEPAPYRPRDHPSKEKPSVKTKVRPKSNDSKEVKANISQSSEKKHRSSHHDVSNKKCSNSQPDKSHSIQTLPQRPPTQQVQSQSKANHRTNITHPAVVVREDFHRDKVLLPIGDNRLPPLKNSHRPHALVVKIELALLSRIPREPGRTSQSKTKKGSTQEPHCTKKEEHGKKHQQNPSKEHTKRKVDEGEKNGTHKKMKLETESKASSNHKQLTPIKTLKTSSENQHKKHRQEKPTSPAEHTHKKSEKLAQKRRPSESSQVSTTSSGKSHIKEPSSSKHRKVEEKRSEHVKSNKGSTENNTNPFPVPSLPNGNAKPTRPQLKFEEKLHSPEHYMKEAKKLKHQADAMSDKIGKAFNYLDAAMFFIECGIAMESDVQAPKSAYTMIAETIDLIKFIMKLKNFADSSSPTHEKSFAILCMRCQSVLYMAMFRYKKDTAIKYSRTLGEHFKSSSRAAQAPSPCVARSTGTPSPLSPTPSPASSGGSQPGSIASNSGSQSSSVTIPQMIHHIASSYVNITSYFLYAYDIWEQADLLAKKNKEFFTDLSAMVCPLALNSTMTELVHYTRQGLQWLRLETSTT